MLIAVQRRMLLRVACEYRTISAAALQVITGTLPITFSIEERKVLSEMVVEDGRLPATKKEVRRRLVEKWQEEWGRNTEVAVWTRELIPNVGTWMDCRHKVLSYKLTQVLSGHGCFRSYTYRIGKEGTPTCAYCNDGEEDTVEHTMTRCRRWEEERMVLREGVGATANTKELINKMVRSKEVWIAGWTYAKRVISVKESEERRRQEVGGENVEEIG